MLRSLRVPFRRLTLLNYQKPKRGPRSLFVSWSSFRNFFYCPSIVDLLWTSGTKRIAGKPVGNLKKILMFQREMSEEGSEPGALCRYDAVCHGDEHWGGIPGPG